MEFLRKWIMFSVALLLVSSVLGMELTRQQLLESDMHAPVNGVTKNTDLSWGYNDTHVEVQLSYPTLGWLALGLSPNGGMDQSDVLFGYVNDTTNEVVVQDRYLTANMDTMSVKLTLDTNQNWQMISGSKNGTHTIIRAVRKIKTCDANDRPFTAMTQSVIYSYNYKLPDSPAGPIRKHNVRGATNINFLSPPETPDPDISGEVTRTLEIRYPNQTITGEFDTQYYCQLTKLPTFDKKYQSIASQPIINAQNMKYIHHMLVYVCDHLKESETKVDFFDCGPKADSFVMKKCQGLIGGWAMGAKPISYSPPESGSPFTPAMSGTQVVVQIHYNNPDKIKFVDDSGIRFFLTDKLRKYDSGAVMAGILSLDWTLTMPPGLDSFHVQGQCSDQCTATQIPPEGVFIYKAQMHMHTRGQSGVARHFRGSQEILPPLSSEMHYDFNLQQSKPILPFRKFMPGDRIVVECNFTTINDSSPIYGGEGSMEEMCMVFMAYYPKADMGMCGSIFRVEPYLKALGLESGMLMQNGAFPKMRDTVAQKLLGNEASLRQLVVKSLKKPVTDFIVSKSWNDVKAQPLEDFYSGMHYMGLCSGNGTRWLIQNDKPPQFGYYKDPAKSMEGC